MEKIIPESYDSFTANLLGYGEKELIDKYTKTLIAYRNETIKQLGEVGITSEILQIQKILKA